MESKINYFDAHADTLTEIQDGENLYRNGCNLDLNRVEAFADRYIQIYAIWKDWSKMAQRYPEKEFLHLYNRAICLLQEQQAIIQLCTNKNELKKALVNRKRAAVLAVEDAAIMGNLIHYVTELKIAIVMLTWNYENSYGCGAAYAQQRGLTEKGKKLAETLVKKGIIIDVSHLSDAGVEDVLTVTSEPVIASHSNVRRICDNPRNLSDTHIREIIKRGGIIGMNYYGPFVESEDRKGIKALLHHLEAILELGGEESLVLGSDFDGCGNHFCGGIKGVESVPRLIQEMKAAGYREELIQKICWENGVRFLLTELGGCRNDETVKRK